MPLNRTLTFLLCLASAASLCAADGDVTLKESDRTFFLDNGILNVRIEKDSGEVFSIKYKGQELLAQDSSGGALGGYWSSVGRARPGGKREAVVRIDPKSNNGERVEISCNFHNTPGSTDSPLDVDVRYSLGRGESWLYTYLIWSHKPGYPAFGAGEARFCAKLNPDVFNYMTIDKDRRWQMPTPEDWDKGAPLNLKEARRMTTGIHKGHAEHKYDYSALIYDIPAYGWSSTNHNIGLWFVNPSFEYMGGGPTKAELTGHLDVNPGGLPTLLNMWLGSHYGGTAMSVGADEDWTKVVGPFLIYCNAAPTQEGMWRDALQRAKAASSAWPYSWVNDPNYPTQSQRSVVNGQIVLRDTLDTRNYASNIWVGLTAPDYVPQRQNFAGGFGRRNPTNSPAGGFTNSFAGSFGTNNFRGGFPAAVDWQRDSKFYQFWVQADASGHFTIPNVRPGNYTLRAIADGVIGEFARDNIKVKEGSSLQLGALDWQPQRFGRTLWQIGTPDRTAREFRHGDHYWQWGLYFQYPKEFPKDVNYIIGRSSPRKDWNYVQPPRILTQKLPMTGEDDENATAQFVRSSGRDVQSTTWTVTYALNQKPQGRATVRLAFCGTHQGCNVEVFVNDKSIGETGTLPSTSAMQRDGIRAFWIEKPLSFDASLMNRGVNTLKLKSHANSWSQGVMYDVVRLELDEPAARTR